MGLIHIYATLSAVEHMTAQFMLSTGLRIAVLRVLPHQAGVALALRASESWTGDLWNPSAWKMGERWLLPCERCL